jgi:hypothetical protein
MLTRVTPHSWRKAWSRGRSNVPGSISMDIFFMRLGMWVGAVSYWRGHEDDGERRDMSCLSRTHTRTSASGLSPNAASSAAITCRTRCGGVREGVPPPKKMEVSPPAALIRAASICVDHLWPPSPAPAGGSGEMVAASSRSSRLTYSSLAASAAPGRSPTTYGGGGSTMQAGVV